PVDTVHRKTFTDGRLGDAGFFDGGFVEDEMHTVGRCACKSVSFEQLYAHHLRKIVFYRHLGNGKGLLVCPLAVPAHIRSAAMCVDDIHSGFCDTQDAGLFQQFGFCSIVMLVDIPHPETEDILLIVPQVSRPDVFKLLADDNGAHDKRNGKAELYDYQHLAEIALAADPA